MSYRLQIIRTKGKRLKLSSVKYINPSQNFQFSLPMFISTRLKHKSQKRDLSFRNFKWSLLKFFWLLVKFAWADIPDCGGNCATNLFKVSLQRSIMQTGTNYSANVQVLHKFYTLKVMKVQFLIPPTASSLW
jgi:hypothetical protein